MARALVCFEVDDDGHYQPVAVVLATPTAIESRWLPGDARRTDRFSSFLADAVPLLVAEDDETQGRSFEVWIDWAIGRGDRFPGRWTNGHTSWAIEVAPGSTVDALFAREVLDVARAREGGGT